jgi:NAD(P)-dependent dehydrogenase (short-subunit alcohol dehydrogenase family)
MTATFGTILITGPTSGLGREATLAMARRPPAQRPDLLLLGRPGSGLARIVEQARASGATVVEIPCDLSRLADVRTAAETALDALAAGTVAPLRGLIANAGISTVDNRSVSADGYELTFAVNYLAHAQLITDLQDSLRAPARIVLLGSNTYHKNWVRAILHVPPADWKDPVTLARPGSPTATTPGGVAYSNSKLAILYYAHELQRHLPDGVNVIVFEPGFMPGTGLSRQFGPAAQTVGRLLGHVPGISTPARSGPALASIGLDDRWAHLGGGAFIVKTTPRDVKPIAHDMTREQRLWEATTELLNSPAR